MNNQIALCNTLAWSIIGPGCTLSGLFQFFPLPAVSCPVLDTGACNPDSVYTACQRYHASPDEDVDVAGLVSALLSSDAKPIFLPSDFGDLSMEKPLVLGGAPSCSDLGTFDKPSRHPRRRQP